MHTDNATIATGRFTVQVLPTGRLGLVEAGDPTRVPDELIRLATGMWAAGAEVCNFLWFEAPGAKPYRIRLSRQTEGSLGYALLDGELLSEIPHLLTPRELEVLTMIVAGASNADLAGELWISTGTAATHVNRLLSKLGVASRTAAATYAIDQGLLHLPLPGDLGHYQHLAVGRLASVAARPRKPPAAVASGTPRRELVVGALMPTTGKGSDDGIEMLNGLQLAIEEINAAGGVRGRTVRAEIVAVDVTSVASVQEAFEALLKKRVDVLTSGYLADQETAHEIAAESGVPYLHAATSGPMEQVVQNYLARFGNIFQICASDTMYAPRFVTYLTQLRDTGRWDAGSNRLVVLRKAWRHVDFGIDQAVTLAGQRGWHLDVVNVSGPEEGAGWYEAMTAALREPAAAVMIGSYFTADAVQAIEALVDSRSPALAYAIYSPSIPAFRHQLGEAADGILWATTTGTYSDAKGVAFARRYTERFGMVPGRLHAGIAYDRMHRIALAWKLADNLADGEEFASHVRSQPFRGVNGTYNFDTRGQVAAGFNLEDGDPSMAQPHLVFQIQHGRNVIIDGGPFKTGEFNRVDHR